MAAALGAAGAIADIAAASAAEHAIAMANEQALIVKKGDDDAQQILG